MTNVRAPICFRLQTAAGKQKLAEEGKILLTGAVRNVRVTNVQATGATVTSSITGIPQLEIQNITLRDVSISTVEPGNLAWLQAPVPEVAASYPKATMFGRLPAYGLYARHVQGLTLQNVTINSQTHDPRPPARLR